MNEALDMIEKRGIEKGIEQGMKTINMLYARLLKDGRIKDLDRLKISQPAGLKISGRLVGILFFPNSKS